MRWDYEEFMSKKGYPVRIMDLRDYFSSLPENEKTEGYNNKEHTCTCPYCSAEAYLKDPTYHKRPYLKQKLYITPDFSTGWCHRCNTAYWSDEFSIHYEIPELIKELGAPSISDLHFSMTHRVCNLSLYENAAPIDDEREDKLYNRNPYLINLYKDLGFKMLKEDTWMNEHKVIPAGSILVPFRWPLSATPNGGIEKGDIFYYQIWEYPALPKYINPPVQNKPLYVYGELKKTAVLVEGVFDALAEVTLHPDWTPIAVLGSTVTIAQDLMLRSMFLDKIYIRMDNSTLSYKLYNRIKESLEFTDLEVLDSNGEDSEEQLCRLAGWNKH